MLRSCFVATRWLQPMLKPVHMLCWPVQGAPCAPLPLLQCGGPPGGAGAAGEGGGAAGEHTGGAAGAAGTAGASGVMAAAGAGTVHSYRWRDSSRPALPAPCLPCSPAPCCFQFAWFWLACQLQRVARRPQHCWPAGNAVLGCSSGPAAWTGSAARAAQITAWPGSRRAGAAGRMRLSSE